MSDEHSEEQLQAVLTTAGEWYAAFAESSEFAHLNASQQRKAGAITEFFARYTYEHLGLSPDEWDCGAVVECCTEILPKKVSAELSFFEAMAPVLRAFFSFLEDRSLVDNGRALAEMVDGLDADIVSNAQDRSNWDLAKHFAMAAHDAGVDIHDHAALQTYMLQFNLQQAARSKSENGTQSSRPFSRSPMTEKTKSHATVGRYDPCPCGSGKGIQVLLRKERVNEPLSLARVK